MANNQWGFYYDQSRCVGCKTCMLACKNWNEERRGDANIRGTHYDNHVKYVVATGQSDKASSYIDTETGANNYAEFRKYYMKEDWRRIEAYETGVATIGPDNAFTHNVDRRYISISCNHCDDPACLVACPVGAIQKDADKGLVLVDSGICISCGRCRASCPWQAPQFYDDFGAYASNDPNRPRMTKCTLCKDRIDIGLKPACVAACWNRALDAGPISELKAKYPDAVEHIRDFKSDTYITTGTKPNILFKEKK